MYSGSIVGFLVMVCVVVFVGVLVVVVSLCGCCYVCFDCWYDDGWEVKFI